MFELVELLKKRQYTISTMESCTGGLFASELTSIAGVSDVFQGSLVTYTNKVKEELGKVEAAIIDEFGVISTQTAEAMAHSCKQMFQTNVAIGITGNAGPTAAEKELGYVCTCIIVNENILTYEDYFSGDRNGIRSMIVSKVMKRLKQLLEEEEHE